MQLKSAYGTEQLIICIFFLFTRRASVRLRLRLTSNKIPLAPYLAAILQKTERWAVMHDGLC